MQAMNESPPIDYAGWHALTSGVIRLALSSEDARAGFIQEWVYDPEDLADALHPYRHHEIRMAVAVGEDRFWVLLRAWLDNGDWFSFSLVVRRQVLLDFTTLCSNL